MWTSVITFERPVFLLLLPICVAALWVIQLRSRALINAVTRQQVFILRAVIVSLIVLALAGFTWHHVTRRLTTIFVIDMSDSVPIDNRQTTLHFVRKSLANKQNGDNVGVVVFGSEPFVEIPPSSNPDLSQITPSVPGDSTDIQSALEAAAGAMPPNSAKRIVLCTDGLENVGDASSSISSLRSQGIQVDIAPTMLGTSNAPETLVDRVVTPSHIDINTPLTIRVVLSSTVAQSARLRVTRDGSPIASGQIHIIKGMSAYYFDDRLSTAGLHNYAAELFPTDDTQQQNNEASSTVLARGSPRILYVRNADEPIAAAVPSAVLAQGLTVVQTTPQDVPTTTSDLAGYDSIILSDVAAGDLSPQQLAGIAEANESFGTGLGMIGGINSFGAGGYNGTPIENALPVKMQPKSMDRVPAADVVIVLDASGSMAAEEDGIEKVEIAAKAALQLLSALQPKDRVAVLAVTETAQIVMPLVSPAESAAYVPQVEAVEAGGGGIDCRNGLEAAYTLLDTSDAAIKHVIICPDTTDSEQQDGCDAIASAQYAGAKITTSVCGIGQWSDSDVPFQRGLAAAGHGQLFVANQAGNLPQFFKRDVQQIEQKLIIEGNFNVETVADDSVVASGSYPPIFGYNLVVPKPGTTVPLTLAGHNDALLAYWRHGVGKSFAYMSDDDAHWSARWIAAPNYSAFWAHLIRWSLKGVDDESFQSLVTDEKGQGHVVVDAFDANGYATDAHFNASIAGPTGSLLIVPLLQTSPGRYESSFDGSSVGSYLVAIRDTDSGGQQTMTTTTPYSPEYANLRPNTPLLNELAGGTGGQFLTDPLSVFRRGALVSLGSSNLSNLFYFLAGLLFILDVAWRRFAWRIGRPVVQQAAQDVRQQALVAAGSIKRVFNRPRVDSFGRNASLRLSDNEADDFLKSRTATRADIRDDDNPFPFVTSLPPRRRQESNEVPSKEDK